MNGSFTSDESKHLSPDERRHYLEIGLCAPLNASDLEMILEKGWWCDRIEELEEELELVKCDQAETVEDLEDLQRKVQLCLEYVEKATVTFDIRDRIRELLA